MTAGSRTWYRALKTRVSIYAETSTLGALAFHLISYRTLLLPVNFRKPRAIYPSAIYPTAPLRRPSFPSDSRTRDLDPDDSIRTLALDLTACTLRA